MSQVPPFYSTRPGENRHHNNNQCTEGNNIEAHYKKSGTGGYSLCSHCAKLNSEGR